MPRWIATNPPGGAPPAPAGVVAAASWVGRAPERPAAPPEPRWHGGPVEVGVGGDRGTCSGTYHLLPSLFAFHITSFSNPQVVHLLPLCTSILSGYVTSQVDLTVNFCAHGLGAHSAQSR